MPGKERRPTACRVSVRGSRCGIGSVGKRVARGGGTVHDRAGVQGYIAVVLAVGLEREQSIHELRLLRRR